MRTTMFLCNHVTALWTALMLFVSNVTTVQAQIIDLTSEEFYDMAVSGQVDLMIDVRTAAEWDDGRIENATFIDSLQTILRTTTDDAMNQTLVDLGLWGCQNCRTVVYCRSGARASVALNLLQGRAGFQGPLYNGQGVSQWQNAGYALVQTPSTDPTCTVEATAPEMTCARSGTAIDNTETDDTGGTIEGADDENQAVPPTSAPVADTTESDPVSKKDATAEAKCGSLAYSLAEVGGSAAQAKDCSRNGNGRGLLRRKRKLRGM